MCWNTYILWQSKVYSRKVRCPNFKKHISIIYYIKKIFKIYVITWTHAKKKKWDTGTEIPELENICRRFGTCLENTKDSTEKLVTLIGEFSKLARYKINILKINYFYISRDQFKKKMVWRGGIRTYLK